MPERDSLTSLRRSTSLPARGRGPPAPRQVLLVFHASLRGRALADASRVAFVPSAIVRAAKVAGSPGARGPSCTSRRFFHTMPLYLWPQAASYAPTCSGFRGCCGALHASRPSITPVTDRSRVRDPSIRFFQAASLWNLFLAIELGSEGLQRFDRGDREKEGG